MPPDPTVLPAPAGGGAPAPAPAPVPAPAPAPANFDAAAAVAQLQQQGYAVFAKDATFTKEQAEADPFLKPIVEGAIASRFSQVYVDLDKDIFDSTGIPKNTGEKTYEYLKRTAAQLRDQIKNAPDVETVKKGYEKQLSDLRDTTRLGWGELAIRSAINALDLNIPAESLDFTRDMLVKQALTKPFRVNDNNQVIFQKLGGEDGKTLIDVVNVADGKPLAVKDYLSEEYKTLLKVARPNPAGPNQQPKPANTNSPIPTTMEEVGNQLVLEGFAINSPEYIKEAQKRKTDYAIVDQK